MKELSLTIGPPTFFLTRSSADLHWSALHEITRRDERTGPDDEYSRHRGVVARHRGAAACAHVASAFFYERSKFLEELAREGRLENYYGVFEWQKRGSVLEHVPLWFFFTPYHTGASRPVGDIRGELCRLEASNERGQS